MCEEDKIMAVLDLKEELKKSQEINKGLQKARENLLLWIEQAQKRTIYLCIKAAVLEMIEINVSWEDRQRVVDKMQAINETKK